MHKYGFNIRTQGGHKVDNIVIMARDFDEAERRLRQMYNKCEILNRLETIAETRRSASAANGQFGALTRLSSIHKPGTH